MLAVAAGANKDVDGSAIGIVGGAFVRRPFLLPHFSFLLSTEIETDGDSDRGSSKTPTRSTPIRTTAPPPSDSQRPSSPVAGTPLSGTKRDSNPVLQARRWEAGRACCLVRVVGR